MRRTFYALLLSLYAVTGNVHAQVPATGPMVQYPVYFDVSPPLRDMIR